jgi:hypothetical protein
MYITVWLNIYSIIKYSFLFSMFLLAYNSCTGSFISMYAYNIPQFGSSPPLFSLFPLLLLKMVSTFHIHTCVENTLTIFTFLYPFHLPSPACRYPLFNMTCFTFLPFIV